MSFTVFSKRHARKLRDKQLEVNLPRRLRGRLRKVMERHSQVGWWHPNPGDNWTEQTSSMEQVEIQMREITGVDQLQAFDYDTQSRIDVNLAGFIDGAYPSQVFDVVELFNRELPTEDRAGFREDLNRVFREEETAWVLVDEHVVMLDQSMLDSGVVDHAVELLEVMTLDGALDEFRDAMDELTDGDPTDAIQDACNAFESVLKALTEENGDASRLISHFIKLYASELPADQQKALRRVLQALPVLGNNLGRHGQGADVIEVDKRYAQLAVHLAGASIIFAIDSVTAGKKPGVVSGRTEKPSGWDEEAPF